MFPLQKSCKHAKYHEHLMWLQMKQSLPQFCYKQENGPKLDEYSNLILPPKSTCLYKLCKTPSLFHWLGKKSEIVLHYSWSKIIFFNSTVSFFQVNQDEHWQSFSMLQLFAMRGFFLDHQKPGHREP